MQNITMTDQITHLKQQQSKIKKQLIKITSLHNVNQNKIKSLQEQFKKLDIKIYLLTQTVTKLPPKQKHRTKKKTESQKQLKRLLKQVSNKRLQKELKAILKNKNLI